MTPLHTFDVHLPRLNLTMTETAIIRLTRPHEKPYNIGPISPQYLDGVTRVPGKELRWEASDPCATGYTVAGDRLLFRLPLAPKSVSTPNPAHVRMEIFAPPHYISTPSFGWAALFDGQNKRFDECVEFVLFPHVMEAMHFYARLSSFAGRHSLRKLTEPQGVELRRAFRPQRLAQVSIPVLKYDNHLTETNMKTLRYCANSSREGVLRAKVAPAFVLPRGPETWLDFALHVRRREDDRGLSSMRATLSSPDVELAPGLAECVLKEYHMVHVIKGYCRLKFPGAADFRNILLGATQEASYRELDEANRIIPPVEFTYFPRKKLHGDDKAKLDRWKKILAQGKTARHFHREPVEVVFKFYH